MRALVVESTSLLVLADKHSINEWIAFSSPPFHGGKKVMRHGDSKRDLGLLFLCHLGQL